MDDRSVQILLSGRIDSNNAAEVEKNILNRLGNGGSASVVLDAESLEYISSAGLRAIKNFYIAIRKNGGTYSVKNVSKPIMDIFEATGFVRLLKL